MTTLTFTIEGDVNVQVLVTEVDGALQFDLSVLDETGSIGDLNALYFDFLDDGILSGLSATGDDVTGSVFEADSVSKVDNFTNINGEVIKDAGKFDAGIQFGTAGIGEDDIRDTSFTLSHADMPLTIDMLLSQDFGVRLTSVGEEGGERDGSLKLGGEAPEDPDEPVSTQEAVDDTLIVFESEEFNPSFPDFLEGFQVSVLENDQLDQQFFETDVTAVNGDANNIAQVVTGSNGGQLIMYVDGTVDFSANDEFDFLDEGETATTSFTYSIEGGSTATLNVIIQGEDGIPPIDDSAPPIDDPFII
ncbi:VCBS domain-containing protein [Roseovarius phycicola]|uniref:VCBS domain-containing protein n=1 Tax=Roseovarius phycicola TaxID=3080976 RepID=A0ABZ2HGU7_9RHOB